MSYYDINRYDLIDISFDLSNCVVGFENYTARDPQTPHIGENVWLLYRHPATNYEGHTIYQFKYLDVISEVNSIEATEPFEDYAYRIFLTFTDDSVFKESDFLTQLIITFWIIAIKKVNSIPRSISNEARMDKEKKQHDRVDKITNHFLSLLSKRTEVEANKFSGRRHLNEADVFSSALNIVSLCITGERPGNIEPHFQNIIGGKDKQKTKREIRHDSLHSAYPYKNVMRPNKTKLSQYLNHKSMAESFSREVLDLIGKTGDFTYLTLLSNDSLLYATADSLNINSYRIYKPNPKMSLPKFLFGSNGALADRLRDLFKTEIRKIPDIEYSDDISYEDNITVASRGWAKHRNNFTKEQQAHFYKIAEHILTKKQKEAYSLWLQDSYVSSDVKMRQHLCGAKKRLRIQGAERPESFK